MTEDFLDSELRFPKKRKTDKKPQKKKSTSVPINIREVFTGSSWVREYIQAHSFDEEEEMVPPHVILEWRIAGKAAFSLCYGIGRTLKGRDLSQVRNTVLRMTGFLES